MLDTQASPLFCIFMIKKSKQTIFYTTYLYTNLVFIIQYHTVYFPYQRPLAVVLLSEGSSM